MQRLTVPDILRTVQTTHPTKVVIYNQIRRGYWMVDSIAEAKIKVQGGAEAADLEGERKNSYSLTCFAGIVSLLDE